MPVSRTTWFSAVRWETIGRPHTGPLERRQTSGQGRIKGRKPPRPHYQKGLLSPPFSSLPTRPLPSLLISPLPSHSLPFILPSLRSRPLKSS